MKKFLNFIFVAMINSVLAQNYEIIYDVKSISDTITRNVLTKEMTLYSTDKQQLFIASSTLQDNSEYLYEPLTTLRNSDQIKRFHFINGNLYSVETKEPKHNWTITNESKYIDEIKCQAAITTYKGRTWKAWFSDQFPIFSGPYVFDNLPGLIVEIYDEKKHYHFTMKSINKRTIAYNIPKSLKVDQAKLNEQYINYYQNPYLRFKNMGMQTWTLEDGTQNNFVEQTKIIQERIRKNNNPIDLTDIINYENYQ